LSPERTGASVDLARLRVEVAEDRAAMSRCLDDVRSGLGHWGTPGPEPEWMALVAVGLHGWYTGLETALERVARAIDQCVPTGDSWHRNLLSQCTADVPPIRPAVLPRALHFDLIELLEFRHFFRHAYGVSLDGARLRDNIDRLLRVSPAVATALDAFDQFLRMAQDALVG
jgi:hypothetical protein